MDLLYPSRFFLTCSFILGLVLFLALPTVITSSSHGRLEVFSGVEITADFISYFFLSLKPHVSGLDLDSASPIQVRTTALLLYYPSTYHSKLSNFGY
jgi:hypothetical protein